MLEERNRVLGKIPTAFRPLFGPHLTKLEAAIEPGLTMLTWTSMNITTYLETVYEALQEVELLIDRSNDLVKYRIENILFEMANVTLCELPTEMPWTIEEFVKKTEVSRFYVLHGHFQSVLAVSRILAFRKDSSFQVSDEKFLAYIFLILFIMIRYRPEWFKCFPLHVKSTMKML